MRTQDQTDESTASRRELGLVSPRNGRAHEREDTTLEFDSDDDNEGVPVYHNGGRKTRAREREASHSMTQAAVGAGAKVVRSKLGVELSDEAQAVITAEIEARVAAFLQRYRDRAARSAPTTLMGSMAGWFAATVLALVLFVGVLGVTWAKIDRVEERQAATDAYEMVVANWLVAASHADFERASNLDSMVRIIAAQIGAKVDAIPAPTYTPPPTAVRSRSDDYLLSKGE